MRSVFEPSLIGKTLAWYPVADPPGGWAYALEDEVFAELEWSSSERAVRMEAGSEIWRVRFSGTYLIRAVLTDVSDAPCLFYAGAARRGLTCTRAGRGFVYFSQADFKEGRWEGFDDADGAGILRVRQRIGPGRWSEVSVTPEPEYHRFIIPLLALWGGLDLLRRGRRRWWALATAFVSWRAAQRALDGLVGTEGPPAP